MALHSKGSWRGVRGKSSHTPRGKRRGNPNRLGFEFLEARMLLSAVPTTQPYALPPSHELHNPNGYLTAAAKGDAYDIAMRFVTANASALGVTASDLTHSILTNRYADADSKITHLYLAQELNGLPVADAVMSVNVMGDGRIINVGADYLPNLRGTTGVNTQPALSAAVALQGAATALGLTGDASQTKLVSTTMGVAQATTLQDSDLSLDPISAKLQYVPVKNGTVLAWEYILRTPDGQHWYDASVDATTGSLVIAHDWVDHASYNVFPRPLMSPDYGSRSVLVDPQDTTYSPFGWHDINGVAGAEFTDTRGNNVFAQEDRDNNNSGGFRPDGGASLNFDFPLDLTQEPPVYQSAAITNLFYMNNVLHDIHAVYGFTEAAGNFQVTNYTGKGRGNDAVQADAQDAYDKVGANGQPAGRRDNANFATPADGFQPRMQMYVWDLNTPERDGDIDNEIIVHEYGHGVSNRLVGGPMNVNALDANQSGGMGEGWGDWWSLMFTQTAADTPNTPRPLGTYALGQAVNGKGLRDHPYSFDMTVDPWTYGGYNKIPAVPPPPWPFPPIEPHEVHEVGEIWCTVLWDMNWELVQKHGFDPNIEGGYKPGGAGNLLALQLVMDGLKLTPANPTFLQGRDAILLADRNLTGGANQYEIWKAFARRGMGYSANGGINADGADVTEAFDVPYDFGDAPDPTYPTLAASNGAGHFVGPLFLGSTISMESDGQPNADATGDTCDDGVVFTTPLDLGNTASVTVTASLAGKLDAWLDLNGDGQWTPDEKIFDSRALSKGANVLTFNIPLTVKPLAQTFARFRLSTAGGLLPTGMATDGEVEDYAVAITQQIDFGDAPDPTYPSLLASNGAQHNIVRGFQLGATATGEDDAWVSPTATGDAGDDGVVLPAKLSRESNAWANVTPSKAGKLDAWVDFNCDGDWSDPGEKIFDSIDVQAGSNLLHFVVPADAVLGQSFARFRLSSAGGLTPTGWAPDGEVEDYAATIIEQYDFGDAPDPTYPTLKANAGAQHSVVDGFYLGTNVLPEPDGQPSANADASSDDNGVQVLTAIVPGYKAALRVTASLPGKLDAWVDFNGDGQWTANEQICASTALVAGANTVIFPVPATAVVTSQAFARFRLSTAGGLAPTGNALDGEVEDYALRIAATMPGFDFGDLAVALDGLDPASDTGIANQPATLHDRITKTTLPTFWGTGGAMGAVTLYVDTNGNGLVDVGGDIPIGPGNVVAGGDPTLGGPWKFVPSTDLNNPALFSTDGLRSMLAQWQDAAGNTFTASLPIFIDTNGPQVAGVDFGGGVQTTLGGALGGSVHSASVVEVTLVNPPSRAPGFVFPAVNSILAGDSRNYQLFDGTGAVIPLQGVQVLDRTSAGTSGITVVRLSFGYALADGNYSLKISDVLQNEPGNALDGEVTYPSSGPVIPQYPSGDGVPGTSFVANFMVDNYPELASAMSKGVQMDLNGNYVLDSGGNDPAFQDLLAQFAGATDVIFTGKFVAAADGVADQFDRLAAYGRDGNHYRWLIDTNNDATADLVINNPKGVNGLPVAGNFDGNSSNGDEIGLLAGKVWYLDTNHDFVLDKVITGKFAGSPVVGDFDGDGVDDLAAWSNGVFHFDLAANGFGQDDATINFGFQQSVRQKPVALDIDVDGIDDIGIWLPDRSGISEQKPGEWYFLLSNDFANAAGQTRRITGTVNTLNHPFQGGRDLWRTFGSSTGNPVVGNFSPWSWAPAAAPAATLRLAGTPGNDTFVVSPGPAPGQWCVTVNGVPQYITPNTSAIKFDGLGGSDAVFITGQTKNDACEMWPDHLVYSTQGLTVTAAHVESACVTSVGQGKAILHDSKGIDKLLVMSALTRMTGTGYREEAHNFTAVRAYASAGGADVADIYRQSSADVVKAKAADVVLAGPVFSTRLRSYATVQVHANAGRVEQVVRGAGLPSASPAIQPVAKPLTSTVTTAKKPTPVVVKPVVVKPKPVVRAVAAVATVTKPLPRIVATAKKPVKLAAVKAADAFFAGRFA